VIAMLAWLPLLLLSALEGELWGGTVAVPFLKDVEVHIRFLVALPLLIVAELVVHQRMRPLIQQFLERNLVPENDLSSIRGRHCLGRAPAQLRVRRGAADRSGLWAWHPASSGAHYMALDTATWYATPSAGGSTLSLAGFWYWLRQSASVPVPAAALVFPAFHLGTIPVAGDAHSNSV
jgi:hypothetical protein